MSGEFPSPLAAEIQRACFVAIHGGGWTSGSPRSMYAFTDHCAKLGMVAVSVEYRLYKARTPVTVFECVKDTRAALRYVRAHAEELGIDVETLWADDGFVVRLPDVDYESRAQMMGLYTVRYRGETMLIRTQAMILEQPSDGVRTRVVALLPDGKPDTRARAHGLLAVLEQRLPLEIEKYRTPVQLNKPAKKKAAKKPKKKPAKKA